MSGLKERIQQRLEQAGKKARTVSMEIGQNPNLLRDIIAGKSKSPRADTIEEIARALDTTAAWLMTGRGPERVSDTPVLAVPLISWVSASGLAHADYVAELDDAPTVALAGLSQAGRWIALRVEGDSMDRISPPESVIFVNTGERALVPNACYVIADESGRATYKRWRPDPDRWEPVSTNPDHETVFPQQGHAVRIIGRVRRSLLEM